MKSRNYSRFVPPLLALFLLISFSSNAQSVKVEGYAINGATYVTQFDGNCFTVQKKDGIAVVDLNGKTLASGLKAPSIMGFRNDKLTMYKGVFFTDPGNGIVLKNVNGQTLGAGKYSDTKPFTTWNTVVRLPSPPGTWIVAYLDTTGKEIVKFDVRKFWAIADPTSKPVGFTFVMLDEFLPFSEGLTLIKSQVSGKYGYVNKSLQLAIPVSFRYARPFSEGLAAVANGNGYWGFIDNKGVLKIPYTYGYSPGRFSSGRAKVQSQDGKYGYINHANQLVIQPKYVYATTFYKGYALAKDGYNNPAVLIDTAGNVLATFPKGALYIDDATPPAGAGGGEPDFEFPFYISETLRELVDEGKGIFTNSLTYGLFDNKGNMIWDYKYQRLSDLHGGKMFAHSSTFVNGSTHNDMGIIDDKGNWLVQIVAPQF